MRLWRLASIMLLGCAAVCKPAASAIISVDWTPGSGDGWITRDTESRKDWLDLTLTVGQPIDQVRTGIWYERGFRLATIRDIREFFIHAGTPDDNFDLATTHPKETQVLARMLGLTIEVDDRRESAYGFTGSATVFTGSAIADQDVSFETHPLGTRFSARLAKVDYLDLTSGGLGEVGEAHFSGGHPFSDEASPNYGSFLVRNIDAPPSVALVLIGLSAYITIRRRDT